MGQMKAGKSKLNVTIDTAIKARASEISDKTRLPLSAMVEASLEAIIKYYESTGHLTLPLHVAPSLQNQPVKETKRKAS